MAKRALYIAIDADGVQHRANFGAVKTHAVEVLLPARKQIIIDGREVQAARGEQRNVISWHGNEALAAKTAKSHPVAKVAVEVRVVPVIAG